MILVKVGPSLAAGDMTAASVAALTVYDMCRAASKDIVIGPIRLLEKSGGRSGHFLRKGASRARKG